MTRWLDCVPLLLVMLALSGCGRDLVTDADLQGRFSRDRASYIALRDMVLEDASRYPEMAWVRSGPRGVPRQRQARYEDLTRRLRVPFGISWSPDSTVYFGISRSVLPLAQKGILYSKRKRLPIDGDLDSIDCRKAVARSYHGRLDDDWYVVLRCGE